MSGRYKHIDRIGTLTKEDAFAPFVLTWTDPFGQEAKSLPVKDDRHDGLVAGTQLADLLERLLPMIESYPYEWPLAGEKLDPLGYDLIVERSEYYADLPPVAYREALRRLGVPPVQVPIASPYRGGERVYAPHLIKLQLTLEKASALSTLSFQFFAKNEVSLLSLVAERDTTGSTVPQRIDVHQMQIEQEKDTLTLLFGEPVYAKRLTFVLGQTAADSNTYYVRQYGENFNYAPTEGDRMRLIDFTSRYHHGETTATTDILTDSDIEDWSEERKAAYIKWRDEVTRRENW